MQELPQPLEVREQLLPLALDGFLGIKRAEKRRVEQQGGPGLDGFCLPKKKPLKTICLFIIIIIFSGISEELFSVGRVIFFLPILLPQE